MQEQQGRASQGQSTAVTFGPEEYDADWWVEVDWFPFKMGQGGGEEAAGQGSSQEVSQAHSAPLSLVCNINEGNVPPLLFPLCKQNEVAMGRATPPPAYESD